MSATLVLLLGINVIEYNIRSQLEHKLAFSLLLLSMNCNAICDDKNKSNILRIFRKLR